jgi:tyrosyl-tRNA synthetase
VALTMPILVGLDGQRKMSKSLGNYVGITEPPDTMFGKIMSISDELMWSYYDLLTDAATAELRALRAEVESGASHPMDVKMDLARRIVADFHGANAGQRAAENFQRVFREREAPAEMPEIRLVRRTGSLEHPEGVIGTLTPKWCQLLAYLRQSESIAVATRLIEQGGFEVNGQTVKDPTARFDATAPGSYDLRLGKKKYLRLIVE